MLEFKHRARRRQTPVAELRRYWSTDGRYAVVHVKSRFGLTGRWLAIAVGDAGEYLLSRHRSRVKAEAACKQHRKGK